MKRIGYLYDKIISVDNLRLAHLNASKGKSKQPGVVEFEKNIDSNLQALHELLKNKLFKNSPYRTFEITDPKLRTISCLPYYPDRIIHHGIMIYLEPIFVACFTADTYSCVKGKGVHAAVDAVKVALKDIEGTKYCLKLDIKKFYPSIDHEILKRLLRRKIKDADLLWLLDLIIDSADGVPIGNYLSQYFANFYLTYFDHWLKEQMKVKYYFRYADDMVIFADNKLYLHEMLKEIQNYLSDNLKLQVKGNYQVFKIANNKKDKTGRGLDLLGYVFYRYCTYLRKRIKKGFARMLKHNRKVSSIGGYFGWAVHCNSKNLLKKLLK